MKAIAVLGIVLCCACSSGTGETGNTPVADPHTDPLQGPLAGNPSGHYLVPAGAGAEDVSSPDHVIGSGTRESCTAEAFIQAVAQGGKITFDCGPGPLTLTLDRPAKVFNDRPDVVIDGGGQVTLSGGGATRILYMNTCDQDQVWTTSHCDRPGPSAAHGAEPDVHRRQLKERDRVRWRRRHLGQRRPVQGRQQPLLQQCLRRPGPDVGGAAIRVFSQYNGLPVYVVNSTFGGAPGYGNICSNGGGISSIGVSWAIYNSLFSYNQAIGNGGNPAQSGTPGGGSGGAIYNDGNTMTLALYGTPIEYNQVNTYGTAIFFVTNDHTGTLHVEDSVISRNVGGSWYAAARDLDAQRHDLTEIINSTIE